MMNRFIILTIIFSTLILVECGNKDTKNKANIGIKETNMTSDEEFYYGTILEVINAKAYTYISLNINPTDYDFIDKEKTNIWIAVEKTPACVGDEIRFKKELFVKEYYSKTLNRNFKDLIFASMLQHKIID